MRLDCVNWDDWCPRGQHEILFKTRNPQEPFFLISICECICIFSRNCICCIHNCLRPATHMNISSVFSQISSFSDKERVDAVIKVFQYKDGISGRGPHYIIGTNGHLTSTLIHIQTPMRIWQKHIKNSLIKTFKVWSPSNSLTRIWSDCNKCFTSPKRKKRRKHNNYVVKNYQMDECLAWPGTRL